MQHASPLLILIAVNVIVATYLQTALEKERSHHSRRASSRDMAVVSGRGLAGSFTPAGEAAIYEEQRGKVTAISGSSSIDVKDEYVIRSQLAVDQTEQNIVEETQTEAVVPVVDAVSSDVRQNLLKGKVAKTDKAKPSDEAIKASAAEGQGPGHLGSQATMSTEFPRQFTFVNDGEDAAGKVEMHSARSLKEMKREKSRIDAILVEALQTSGVDKLHLEKDEKVAIKTAEQLDEAAKELSNYSTKIAILSVSDNLPLSETAIRAAAAVTVNVLNRAIHDELRQLPASGSGFSFSPYQIQRAAVIVSRVLNAAANRKVSTDVHQLWTAKVLHAAILLVDDVLSMAILYVSRGGDAKSPWSSSHVWTTSAIRATCRIIRDVTDEAARQASTAKEQSTSQRLPTPQTSQLPTGDADAVTDQLALEDEAVALSSARLDAIGQQPSSLALEPSDLVAVNNSNINSPMHPESADASSSSPTATRRSEAATAPDNANANANNRTNGLRDSGGRLRQLFGRRRRDM